MNEKDLISVLLLALVGAALFLGLRTVVGVMFLGVAELAVADILGPGSLAGYDALFYLLNR